MTRRGAGGGATRRPKLGARWRGKPLTKRSEHDPKPGRPMERLPPVGSRLEREGRGRVEATGAVQFETQNVSPQRVGNKSTRQGAGQDDPPAHMPAEPGAGIANPGPGGDKEGVALIRPVLQLVSLVVAPTTLLTALLYYFGWLSTNRFSRYFGIDPSTLGFSSQDYLLRGIRPGFPPLIFLAAFGLLFVWIHRQLSEWIHFARHPKALQAIIRTLFIMGLALVFIGSAGLAGHPLFWPNALVVGPLTFGLGIVWAAYGLYLRTEIRQRAGRDGRSALGVAWVPAAHLALVYSLIVLSIFWGFGDAAEANGARRAVSVAEHLIILPGVDVYSKQDLDLGAGTVKPDEIPNANSLYRFRYSGLRILVHSGGKYFLVPRNWPDATRPVAIVLPDDGSLRFEFTPPGFP
jgi:hypothetical protein